MYIYTVLKKMYTLYIYIYLYIYTSSFHDFNYSFAAEASFTHHRGPAHDKTNPERLGKRTKKRIFGPCVLMISPFDAEMKNETFFGVTSSRDVKKFGDSLGYIRYFENFQHVD